MLIIKPAITVTRSFHISRNCLKLILINKLLKHAFVVKHALNVESGHPWKNKKQGDLPTCRKESGWLAEETQAQQKTDIEVESEFDSLPDSNCEAGKCNSGS
jgi:hypothetical protein